MKSFFFTIVLLTTLLSCSDSDNKLQPLNQQQPILAFGDSLTFGKGTTEKLSYPSQLAALLDIEVINEGVSGELSIDGLKRLGLLLDRHNPQLLLLCHGGNDILKKQNLKLMADNLKSMIKMAQDRNIQVVLLALPRPNLILSPIKEYQNVADEMQIVIENEIISEVLQQPRLHSDMVHPNHLGYQKIAEAIEQLLQKKGALG
jgi:acyl-CoA thioesterase-1